jgi:hypothetical protein
VHQQQSLSCSTTNKIGNLKSISSIIGKSSKNPKKSSMCCNYCDKNNQNTADFRAINKFKQQIKAFFETKAEPRKKSLAVHFEESNAFKKKLKPEKIASSKKSTNKG